MLMYLKHTLLCGFIASLHVVVKLFTSNKMFSIVWLFAILCSVFLGVDGAVECDEHFPKCSAKLDLVLMTDSSGSMGDNDWLLVLEYMENIAKSFTDIGRKGLKMAVILFSNNATVMWDLSRPATLTRERLMFRISQLKLEGGFTNIVDAIDFAKSKVFDKAGNRNGVPNRAILMTDGRVAHKSGDLPDKVAKLHSVSRVVSVGVTTGINQTQLEVIASDGAAGFFFVNDFDGLPGLVPQLIEAICPAENLIQEPGICRCKNKRDNSKWKKTITIGKLKCVKCNCKKLSKNVKLFKKACKQNTRGTYKNCCNKCEKAMKKG